MRALLLSAIVLLGLAPACVKSRDGRFPESAAGERVKATLDPLHGEGGPSFVVD